VAWVCAGNVFAACMGGWMLTSLLSDAAHSDAKGSLVLSILTCLVLAWAAWYERFAMADHTVTLFWGQSLITVRGVGRNDPGGAT
jgi:hypothetical protein